MQGCYYSWAEESRVYVLFCIRGKVNPLEWGVRGDAFMYFSVLLVNY